MNVFADGLICASITAIRLQKVLNEVDKYLKDWGLEVRNKTKYYFL
jgi:hypothetical protein